MLYQEFSPLPGARRPRAMLAPDSGAGGAGIPSADQRPSSEGFDQIPFYIDLNKYQLQDAPIAQRILDAGTGTGSAIQWLFDLRKIRSPFNIVGVDINEVDLAKAHSRLARLVDQAKGDSLTFVKRSADALSRVVADRSVELMVALNSIHLYKDPERFFRQAWRKLQPRGELFVNTAYASDVMFPDPVADRRAWGNIVSFARIDLKRQGYTDIPRPEVPGEHSSDEYIAMAKRAGFRVLTEIYPAKIPREQAKILVMVEEFARGVIPKLPLDAVREALSNAVDTTLDRSGAPGLNRNWLLMSGIRELP